MVDQTLRALSDAGFFNSYIHSCQPHAIWTRLRGVDANGDAPSRRGGHAMCMDAEHGLIYLFGGWDGQKSLDDFWEYNVQDDRWRVISHSVAEKNGPGPRACHKMVFDPKTGCIYVLGRLSDGDLMPAEDKPTHADRDGVDGNAEVTPPADGNGNMYGWSGRRALSSAASPPTDPAATVPEQTTQAAGAASTSATVQSYSSEFYRYRTRGLDQGKWELLAFDTAVNASCNINYLTT